MGTGFPIAPALLRGLLSCCSSAQCGWGSFLSEGLFASTTVRSLLSLVFNGRFQGLTGEYALKANVNEIIRIYYGVGGPNLASSFHIIGEIFERVYQEGDLVSPPRKSVQTTLVPPGGAAVVEL